MNNKIWFASDHHFNHNKEFIYKDRGFLSITEMNEQIVRKHNSVVEPEDTVYFLGDVIMGPVTKESADLVRAMHGHKILIMGNHDTPAKVEKYKEYELFEEYNLVKLIKYKKKHLYLSHYPTIVGNFLEKQVINICGHNHFKFPGLHMEHNCYHVELDAHFCYPTPVDEILTAMKEYWDMMEEQYL